MFPATSLQYLPDMLSEKPWPPERVLQLLIRLFASMLIGLVLVNWINTSSWFGAVEAKLLTLIIGTLSFHGVALVLTQQFLRDQSLSWEEAFGFLTPPLGRAMLLA